jgi:transposase
VDETTLKLLCYLVKCWMRRGQQLRIPTPGVQKWHHLFGAYNWRTDEVITMKAEEKNTASFCLFIEHLMQTVPDDRPVVLVLDNASYHHSYVSQAMLAYFEDRSLIFWLPVYCSELNPIERFWRHLKQSACANRLFKTIQELLDSVDKVLTIQNDLAHPDRFLFLKT